MKIKGTVVCLFMLMMMLELIHIYMRNKVSSDSIYATKVRTELAQYKGKNMSLRIEILDLTSFNALYARAQELGYVEPKEFISLYTPLQVALGK